MQTLHNNSTAPSCIQPIFQTNITLPLMRSVCYGWLMSVSTYKWPILIRSATTFYVTTVNLCTSNSVKTQTAIHIPAENTYVRAPTTVRDCNQTKWTGCMFSHVILCCATPESMQRKLKCTWPLPLHSTYLCGFCVTWISCCRMLALCYGYTSRQISCSIRDNFMFSSMYT